MGNTDSPATPKYLTKKLRIPQSKIEMAQAMLDSGLSYQKVTSALDISAPTVAKIKHQRVASAEQAEKIKKGLRNRFAAIADRSLNSLDDTKLAEASAKDLIYIASKATEIALGGQASVVETYTQSLKAYMTDETPQPVVGPGEITKTVTITTPSNP